MSRPEKVTILGKEIKIIYKIDDNSGLMGEYDPKTKTITIVDHPDFESTLFHECGHACLDISGISRLLKENIEEAIIAAIENGLFGIYKRDF